MDWLQHSAHDVIGGFICAAARWQFISYDRSRHRAQLGFCICLVWIMLASLAGTECPSFQPHGVAFLRVEHLNEGRRVFNHEEP